MISVNTAKRLVKRALLANIATEKKNLSITPLISGKHGIGKSAIVESIADELGGVCMTIEGGTLKEGEITGLPYQYDSGNGHIAFRFLPYYAVERIQETERAIFKRAHASDSSLDANYSAEAALSGDVNRFAMNNISPTEKVQLLSSGEITPVIVFIDEINRTENTVYKELMNILLTRTVNGYRFPWWVFFVGAMNPSTQNSVYATNEMDPAQLDRFLKLKVTSNAGEWLRFGKASGISPSILRFIKDHPKCLSESSAELEDEERPTPSPRGWDMVDTILSSEPLLRPFFTEAENSEQTVERDMKALVSAKLGSTVATMYFASLVEITPALSAEQVLGLTDKSIDVTEKVGAMTVAKRVQTCDAVLSYLADNIEFLMLDKTGFEVAKTRLSNFIDALDPSTKLLFAQKVAATMTSDGNSLIEFLFDIFEGDLTDMLDLSDETRALIEKS